MRPARAAAIEVRNDPLRRPTARDNRARAPIRAAAYPRPPQNPVPAQTGRLHRRFRGRFACDHGKQTAISPRASISGTGRTGWSSAVNGRGSAPTLQQRLPSTPALRLTSKGVCRPSSKSNTFRLPSSPETSMDTRALREYWTSILPLKQQGSQKKHSSLPSLYRIHSRSLKSSAPNRRGPGLLETTPQLKPNPIYIT